MIAAPRARAARAALAVGAGTGLGLSFPEPGWWILLVPSLAALYVLLVTGRARAVFFESWLAGLVFQALALRWFATVILDHTALGPLVAWSAVLAAGAVVGLMLAACGVVVARTAGRFGPLAGLCAAPIVWVALERLREAVPVAFPWSILAAAPARHAFAADVARLAGSATLSLLLAALAAAIAAFVLDRRRGGFGLAAAIVVLVLAIAGGASIDAPCRGIDSQRVAVLQGSLPRDATPREELDVYAGLTREAAVAGAGLIVWPESAVPFRIDSDEAWRGIVYSLAAAADVDIVLGSVTNDDEGRIYNSAALVREDRGLASVSSKRVLVPFGEFMPFRPLLGSLPVLVDVPGDFSPGRGVTLHDARAGSIGALICYESVFPGLGCELAGRGATLLVTMTNDSWFGRTGGPEQHLLHGLLRAAETRRPLLRAAHSGVSAIVDGDGRIVGERSLGERGALVADVTPCAGPAAGCRAGRVVAGGCAILAAVLMVAAFLPAPLRRAASASSRPLARRHPEESAHDA